MSKFMLTASTRDIAGQIAGLLNAGGQLAYVLVTDSILLNGIEYVIEMNGETVVGVIGLQKYGRTTELKHLCVHPHYRKRGIGRKLLKKGIDASQTEFVFGMVRSDNHSNIRNNFRVGMTPIGKKRGRGCNIIIFARRKDGHVRQRIQNGRP